ncbi:related to methenyltetrahydrofolate synthetase [Cephalotrichum gorgonifer]|uniref:5-formyltetrahydrofolate cyclo-ligase n=1 Tax=Cephalotrichum gorgonifer TaxID=2041049 RepID=A0AAE8SSL0_9PEZI|nr:related to methenyltetrahydrofolate synthetase [Cephalotrichum gorgonifer]
MSTPLIAAKQHLRAVMKKHLATISQESVAAQSRILFETLKSFQPYRDAKRISVYLNMSGGEIQTDAIVRDALSSGKAVYVPFLHKTPLDPKESPARVMDMVQLKSIADYEALQPDKWGIPSIEPSTVNERHRILGPGAEETAPDSPGLDLMLMPGVAFDFDEVTGHIRRLGHGRGFYDFFIYRYSRRYGTRDLKDHTGHIPVLLYGLALKEQFLIAPEDETIPVGPLDEPPHGVLIGDGTIKHTMAKSAER